MHAYIHADASGQIREEGWEGEGGPVTARVNETEEEQEEKEKEDTRASARVRVRASRCGVL